MNCRKNTESKNLEVAKIKNRNKERIQKTKETRNSRYIIQLNKIRFAFNFMWLMDILMRLSRRTVSDKILCDKEFDIAKNLKYNEYKRCLTNLKFYG